MDITPNKLTPSDISLLEFKTTKELSNDICKNRYLEIHNLLINKAQALELISAFNDINQIHLFMQTCQIDDEGLGVLIDGMKNKYIILVFEEVIISEICYKQLINAVESGADIEKLDIDRWFSDINNFTMLIDTMHTNKSNINCFSICDGSFTDTHIKHMMKHFGDVRFPSSIEITYIGLSDDAMIDLMNFAPRMLDHFAYTGDITLEQFNILMHAAAKSHVSLDLNLEFPMPDIADPLDNEPQMELHTRTQFSIHDGESVVYDRALKIYPNESIDDEHLNFIEDYDVFDKIKFRDSVNEQTNEHIIYLAGESKRVKTLIFDGGLGDLNGDEFEVLCETIKRNTSLHTIEWLVYFNDDNDIEELTKVVEQCYHVKHFKFVNPDEVSHKVMKKLTNVLKRNNSGALVKSAVRK